MRRLGLVAAVATVAVSMTVVAVQAQSIDERLSQTQAALEDSTQVVAEAGATLDAVASQLPAAQAASARAGDAQEVADREAGQARAEAVRATQAAVAGQERVQGALDELAQGRAELDDAVRRDYVRGGLTVTPVLAPGSVGDLLEGTAVQGRLTRGRTNALRGLTAGRLQLEQARDALQQDRDAAGDARSQAEAREAEAAAAAATARSAQAAVEALRDQQRRVLAVAEAGRAADQAAYEQAQADSAALAERLRQEAAERARQEAAEKARQEAADRAQAAADVAASRPAAPPRRVAPPRTTAQGKMAWPASGRLTSRFGSRAHPIFGDVRLHAGIDIGAPSGAATRAADDGVVVFAGTQPGYGDAIAVSHGTVGGRDVVSFYAHQSALLVRSGQKVSRGEQIGRVGSTGNSTGPHLHFEVRLDGSPVDPLDWVNPP